MDGEGEERPAPLSCQGGPLSCPLVAWGQPCDIPQQGNGLSGSPSEGERTGAHSGERQQLEDEAAEIEDGDEGGHRRGGGGCLDARTHRLHVPALPCFSLTQSPSQRMHKDILHYLCLLQLLPPPVGTSARPGQGPACSPVPCMGTVTRSQT